MSSFISFNTYSEIGWVRPALLLVSRVFVQTIGISSNQDNKYYVHNGESFIFIFDGSLMHTQHIHTQINKAHWSCNTKYLFWIFLRTARADGVVEANYGVLWSHCQSISWYKSFELEWRVCVLRLRSHSIVFFFFQQNIYRKVRSITYFPHLVSTLQFSKQFRKRMKSTQWKGIGIHRLSIHWPLQTELTQVNRKKTIQSVQSKKNKSISQTNRSF